MVVYPCSGHLDRWIGSFRNKSPTLFDLKYYIVTFLKSSRLVISGTYLEAKQLAKIVIPERDLDEKSLATVHDFNPGTPIYGMSSFFEKGFVSHFFAMIFYNQGS